MDLKDEVLIIGAGIAGLTAAVEIAAQGRRVRVVEARDRVGGRVCTVHPPEARGPVELGAEFVHGQPPELLEALSAAGILLEEVSGVSHCFHGGELSRCSEDHSGAEVLERLPQTLKQEGDMSFDAFLARHPVTDEDAKQARSYVEGFNAADASRIGIAALERQQAAEESIKGDRAWRPVGGYQALADHLAARAKQAGADIRLRTQVERIRWSPGEVIAEAAGQTFRADAAILTLPLGVLQARGVAMEPEPIGIMAAVDRMAAGSVQRLVLVFREPFWTAKAPQMGFLFADAGLPATWWTQQPSQRPVLVGWLGGPRALFKEASDPELLLQGALRSLERIFMLDAHALDALLESWYLHDWQKDPLSRGAYSYAPVGAVDCSLAMAQPVEQTLYFAGEHTDITGHWGTVHGAMRSGLRAARQLLEAAAR